MQSITSRTQARAMRGLFAFMKQGISGTTIAAMLLSSFAFALPAAAVADTTVVVSPSNMNGWSLSNLEDFSTDHGSAPTPSGTEGYFATGPSTPPAGTGSFEQSIGTDGNDGQRLWTSAYNGVALSSLTTIQYSTYVQQTGSGGQATYMQIRVDLDDNGTTDEVLFFEPVYQTGSYGMVSGAGSIPNQCVGIFNCVASNEWQTWDASAGGWWVAGGPPLTTLAKFIADNPGAKLATDVPALRLTSGFGAGAWDNFRGNVDALVINDTTYDFELTASVEDIEAPSVPVLTSPTNGSYLDTNNFTFTWQDSTDNSGDPVTYEFQSSLNPAESSGVLTTNLWSSGTLTSPEIVSSGAPDGTWYWQVRAKDASGNYSAWSDIWNVTLDTVAPAAPTLVAPTDGATVPGANLINEWSHSGDDVDYFIYESYHDAAATNLRFHGEYTTTSKSATNVANTTFWWRVKAVDLAGNKSEWSDLWKVTVDNTPPPTPTYAKVYIHKYLQEEGGITQVPNDASAPSFPMTSSWDAANIGSGSGSYVLGNNHGGMVLKYAAATADMETPADYATEEVTDGNPVLPIGAQCVLGKYRLVGYQVGSTLEAAEAAEIQSEAPEFTDIASDRHVIVVNEDCNYVLSEVEVSEITAPASDYDNFYPGPISLAAHYVDVNGDNNDGVQWAVRLNSCTSAANTVMGNVDGYHDSYDWDNENFEATFNAVTPGNYCFVFNPSEDAGNPNVRLTRWFTVVEPPQTTATVTMCKVDATEEANRLEGWTLMLKGEGVGSFEVPANDPVGVESPALLADVSYLFEVVGTWLNSGQSGNYVDAEFSTQDDWDTQMDGFTGYGENILDLQMDEQFVEWGAYNSGHAYARSAMLSNTGGTINFRVFDGQNGSPNAAWYADNQGLLSVQVSTGYAGITDENGCVTFSEVPYGTYTLREVAQDGWEFVPGQSDGGETGSITVNEPNEIFTLTNQEEPEPVVEPEDTTPPTAVITTTASDPTSTSPIPMTVTFSEEVIGFDISDISVSNGSVGNFAPGDSGLVYTFDLTPGAEGEVIVSIAEHKYTDLAGNENNTQAELSITYEEEEQQTFTTFSSGGGGQQPVGSSGTAPGSGGSLIPTGEVLGAQIDAGEECSNPLLTAYMRMGMQNPPAQVSLLQAFLNGEMGSSLPITGVFGTMTDAVVKQFQLKYAADILTPWGITEPTGYVYKLTQRKINLLTCSTLNLPVPELN